MAVVEIRARTNTDHSLLVNRMMWGASRDTYRAECCCGWRGNLCYDQDVAYAEADWHKDNHLADRYTVWVLSVGSI